MARYHGHIDNADAFGARLRAARTERRMPASQLCEGLCSAAYVSRIEVGQRVPSLQLIVEFARRLDADPEWLAQGEGMTPAPETSRSPKALSAKIKAVRTARRAYEQAVDELLELLD